MRYNQPKFSDSLPCLVGWRNNLKALLNLSHHLKTKFDIDCISMHNCSQDCVENFFSRMRSGGGNRDNPSAQEFVAEYRKVLVDSLFDPVRGSNCSLDAGDFLLKMQSMQEVTTDIVSDEVDEVVEIVNVPTDLKFSALPENEILDSAIKLCLYVRTNFCRTCSELVCVETSNMFPSNHIYYMDTSKNCTDRLSCSSMFLVYVRSLYFVFNNCINDIIYKRNIFKLFRYIVNASNISLILCGTCVIDNIINYFLKERLKYFLKKDNFDKKYTIKNGVVRSRKLLKLQHI